nr:hypothetical protein [Nocardia farcinica]
MVAQASAASTDDGSIGTSGISTPTGRPLVNTGLTWMSDSPLPLMMRLQVIRSYRTIVTSNPNAVEIWDSWRIGVGQPAADPTSYGLVNSICRLAIDHGTNSSALPNYARVHQDYPATASEEWVELPAGEEIDINYRCFVWTPPPWSNNASANSPLHEVYARGVKLRLWAFPMADETVR